MYYTRIFNAANNIVKMHQCCFLKDYNTFFNKEYFNKAYFKYACKNVTRSNKFNKRKKYFDRKK